MKKYYKPDASLENILLDEVIMSSGIGSDESVDVTVGWEDLFPNS